MSYRGIKRLLGETSLERKCQYLLGGGLLALILLSFWLAGRYVERMVWGQTLRTGQQLANHILLQAHWPRPEKADKAEGKPRPGAIDQADPVKLFESFQRDPARAADGPEETDEFIGGVLLPRQGVPLEKRPINNWQGRALDRLRAAGQGEEWGRDQDANRFQYLKAVTVQASCLQCHPTAQDRRLGVKSFKEGELMAAVSVSFPLEKTEVALNLNRAVLLAFAIGTAVVAMVLAYVIVRYVIVKPVAHLKEVSEEVAAGNLTVRAAIRTGDEFQELSVAFNRMLRSLVAMQDELRRVNVDLDLRLDDLAKANMQLFEMNRVKSDFLATISHELRTPLNSILGFSELLADVQELPEKKRKWVLNIQSSGKLLLGLISNILDLAKLEAGRMQPVAVRFQLKDLVEAQLQMVRPLADQKKILLQAAVEPTLPALEQDDGRLAQILNNLLSNAIKFTPEGGSIWVTAKADRAHVVLAVRDNGIGIAPEDQKRVFDKFRQAESTLTRHHGGTGLGLSIVRELAKLLGGDEVQLESELGRGSTFTVRLPMRLPERPAEGLSLGRDGLAVFEEHRRQEVRYYTAGESRPVPLG